MAAVKVDPKRVHEFVDEKAFDKWLSKNWDKETEVWIRIFKKASGKETISPIEAIDACLCWGWIDAVRKGLDEESFLQRYTPRGKKSVWSQVNVANVERLTKAKKMKPSVLAVVEAAKADGRWANAYRQKSTEPPPDLMAAIRADKKASAMYDTLSSQNRFALAFRTMSLKTPEGRAKKIATFVEMLRKGETIYPQKAATAKKVSAR